VTVAATLLDSRYLLDEEIGAGGSCEVWRATDCVLTRPVAVKLLHPAYARQPEALARFKAEARHAGALSHDNIARVYDYGEPEHGQSYLVMELIDGPSLDTVLAGGPLDAARTMDIVAQVAAGLQAAHSTGLIHRDIKPSNIMFTLEDVAKICDFGLARQIHGDPSGADLDIVRSSPAYASPEQSRGRPDLDHRTDMYSLGVTLFEMLTGKRPFAADSTAALLAKHATEAPPQPRSLNLNISPAANELIGRLLKKKPEQRFDSYDQLLVALDAT